MLEGSRILSLIQSFKAGRGESNKRLWPAYLRCSLSQNQSGDTHYNCRGEYLAENFGYPAIRATRILERADSKEPITLIKQPDHIIKSISVAVKNSPVDTSITRQILWGNHIIQMELPVLLLYNFASMSRQSLGSCTLKLIPYSLLVWHG